MDKPNKIFFSSNKNDKLNANSTLSASNRKRTNLFNSRIKLDRKKIDYKYKSPKSKICTNKKIKNYKEEIFIKNNNDNNDKDNNIKDNNVNNGEKDSDSVIKSDNVRKCLFDSIKTQDENEMILTQNINIIIKYFINSIKQCFYISIIYFFIFVFILYICPFY